MRTAILQRIASLTVATALVAATVGVSLVASTSAQALGPNAIRAGFNTTTFGPNDDGTYPCIGPQAGDPSGTCPNPPAQISLPFSLNFFGTTYNKVYLNNNGNLTFDAPLFAFTPSSLSTTSRVMIAPFFADVDTRTGNTAKFGTGFVGGHTAWGATWPGVACFNKNTSVQNYFQVLLISRSDIAPNAFDIEFNYDQIKWDTGQGNQGGPDCINGNASARVGYTNGNAVQTFELPGSGANNAFLDANSATGLVKHSRNSTQLGRYLFSVRNGSVLPTLTVAKGGTGAGSVSSNPAGISCGADCSQDYAPGTGVTLSAAAAPGSVFAGWSGGGCSGTGACHVTMNMNRSVTASFNLAAPNAWCSGTNGAIDSVLTNNGVGDNGGLLLVKKGPQQFSLSASTQSCIGGWVDAARTKMKVTTATAVNCATVPHTPSQAGVTLGGSGTFTWTAPDGMGTTNFNIRWLWTSNTKIHFWGSVSAAGSAENVFRDRHITGDLTTTQSLASVGAGGNCTSTIPLKHFDVTSLSYFLS